ncbi:hypothetical protein ACHAWF_006881 [Thalassiosira exigua]
MATAAVPAVGGAPPGSVGGGGSVGGAIGGGRIGSSSGDGDGDALILSLYLIGSEDDLLLLRSPPPRPASPPGDAERKRARLYRRLRRAREVADAAFHRATEGESSGAEAPSRKGGGGAGGGGGGGPRRRSRPWSSGGDGPRFGIHCRSDDDDGFDGDPDRGEPWQTRRPGDGGDSNERMREALRRESEGRRAEFDGAFDGGLLRQPHLRAVCRYGNDVGDAWRCVSLAMEVSKSLSSTSSPGEGGDEEADGDLRNLTCAFRIWDKSDGHLLLVEAADALPAWVDDDVEVGGAGGPHGCRERCWIVNGEVALIPPIPSSADPSAGTPGRTRGLTRGEALKVLTESYGKPKRGQGGEGGAKAVVYQPVQRAILDRISLTDYSGKRSQRQGTEGKGGAEPHWHVAAAALPASVARFLDRNPLLAPLLVDSFCEGAPGYLKDRRESDRGVDIGINERDNGSRSRGEEGRMKADSGRPERPELGSSFPYDRLVVRPVTLTRTNYAELVSGRGRVPSFPVPRGYRSAELNRLGRRLRQTAADDVDDDGGRRKNPFRNAVDVGARLCAGLEWILSDDGGGDSTKRETASNWAGYSEDAAVACLSEAERRVRVHWTRIDAEARGGGGGEGGVDAAEDPEVNTDVDESDAHWIERAWRAGPNGVHRDKTLVRTLEAMSRCPVYHPELSRPPREELRDQIRSRMRKSTKWVRNDFDERCFPMPKMWEVDDDGWAMVDSVEELEEEMRRRSARVSKDLNEKESGGPKARRTTRRSRRNLARTPPESETKALDGSDGERSEGGRILAGFQSFVEGEGELEGAVPGGAAVESTHNIEHTSNSNLDSDVEPKVLASIDVDVDPRTFLDVLHSMLKGEQISEITQEKDVGEEDAGEAIDDAELESFFFREDLEEDLAGVEGPDNTNMHIGADNDPWSLRNIMEAMDDELRTDPAPHPSVRGLSVASDAAVGMDNGGPNDSELAMLSDLLGSIDAQGGGAGPATTILRGMGLCPPRPPADEAD